MRHALLWRLAGYLRPQWASLLALLVLMALGAFLEVLPSELTLRLINRFMGQGSLRGAAPLIAGFFGILVAGFLVSFARYFLLARVGQRAMLDLRVQLFAHLMGRSTDFFHRNPVGRLMTRVTSDVQNLNEMFASGFVAIVGDALSLLAIVAWMFWTHAGMALVALGILPFLLVATEVFRRRAGDAFRETQRRYAAINAFLQEQISGMGLVQVNAQEARSAQQFQTINEDYFQAFLRTIFAYAVFVPVVEFITSGTLAALIFYAGFKLQAGAITWGLLLAFARMLYLEPAVLLLDEATANIDSETEAKIQKVIERVSHRLTTFTIAHRLSTIRDADEIWVLDQGALVERGTHDGLIAQDGVYAKLVRLQFAEGEAA